MFSYPTAIKFYTNFIQLLKTIREVKCQHSVNESIIRSTNLISFAISCKLVLIMSYVANKTQYIKDEKGTLLTVYEY